MKKKIKNINGWNIIWLLIYLMPMLLFIGYLVIMANFMQQSGISGYTFDSFQSPYINVFQKFFGGTNGFLFIAYNGLLSYFFTSWNDTLSMYFWIIPLLLQYITIVSVVRIGVDVILMLPNIVHNFIDKIGGERE